MRDAIDPERPLFVTSSSREQVAGFLAELMYAIQTREWEESARLSAFGMKTLLDAHFPDLKQFLKECLVPDKRCKVLEATVDVQRFLFHLNTLKVSLLCFSVYQTSFLVSKIR